jgi:gluconolactonase
MFAASKRCHALQIRFRTPAPAALLVLAATVTAAHASLITPGATLVQVYSDSLFFEGPSWDPVTASLYFSSLTGSGQLFRLTPPNTVGVWMNTTLGINGTFLAHDGRLLCAQGNTRSILSVPIGPTGPGDPVTLAHDSAWNAPNDICQTPNGNIYFTTPSFGSSTPSVVYCLLPGGTVIPAVTDMPLCNGVIASLDGQILYVSDSSMKWWRSYPINPDGTVGTGTVFFNPSTPNQNDPDGMTIDEFGNLYFAGRGGFWIVSPAGQQLEMVSVPQFVTNLTFGGVDGRTLYITCDGKLYSLAMEIRGGPWHDIPDNNQPPQVDAGPDQTISSRTYRADLHGAGSDDGLPNPPGAVTMVWSKISGPGTVTFSDVSAVDTTSTFSAVGTYVLQLLAYDGIRSTIDQVTIRVLRAGDLDNDTDVDASDLSTFWSCITGPEGGPPAAGCALADLDLDQDVDQADFGLFQRCLSGNSIPSEPACAD